MRNTVRETVKLGLVLMIIAAISGISLAYVNGITEPIIEERKREETALAMKVVLPHAVVFEDLSDDEITAVKNLDSDFKTLMSASIGYGEDGGVVGAVISFSVNGYGGSIEMLAGLDSTITKSGMKVMSHSETAGLGAKIKEDSFITQFAGHSVSDPAKLSRDGGDIDAIAGATISSRAAVTAADLALRLAKCVLER